MSSPTTKASVVTCENLTPQYLPGCGTPFMVTVDRDGQGCLNLVQRLFFFRPGKSSSLVNQHSEDILFVISGKGEIEIDGRRWPLVAETAALVQAGQIYAFHNTAAEELCILSVLAPQPNHPDQVPPAKEAVAVDVPILQAEAMPTIAAGPERSFRVLVDPGLGARYVTQFLGCIEHSRAEEHSHSYEEVIYILGGEGIAHFKGSSCPIKAGSCLYLPIGAPHCLENPHQQTLRLLGVFCPAGSPANRMA